MFVRLHDGEVINTDRIDRIDRNYHKFNNREYPWRVLQSCDADLEEGMNPGLVLTQADYESICKAVRVA